jgi:hypothetical protein
MVASCLYIKDRFCGIEAPQRPWLCGNQEFWIGRITPQKASKPMFIGYARVSTVDQNLALQRDALTEAGCQKIFTEQMSGAVADRPALLSLHPRRTNGKHPR